MRTVALEGRRPDDGHGFDLACAGLMFLVGLVAAGAAGFGGCLLMFRAGWRPACAFDSCAPRSGASGGPEGGKERGCGGKPRGNPGAVGKGAPVVSPAEPKARMLLT